MIYSRRIMCFVVVAAMAFLSVLPARAGTVTVTILQRRESSPPCNSPTDIFEITTLADSEPHTFLISACVTSVGIVASDNQTNIGNINIQPLPNQLPGVVSIGIAGPAYAGCGGNAMGSSRRGLNFAGLTTSGFTSRLYGGINGDLTGSILVSELCGFEVGGVMRAGIFAGKIAPLDVRPEGATVRAQEIRAVGGAAGRVQIQDTQDARKLRRVSVTGDVTGSIENFGGPIGDVEIGGNLLNCSIIASGSSSAMLSTIDSIQVAGNIMFSTSNTGSNAPIRARGGIGAIRARSITGNITANANNGSGSIGELTTGWNAASGTFHYAGNLLATTLGASAGYSDGIHIRGDLQGTLSFGGGGIRRPIIVDGNVPLIGSPSSLTNIDSTGALFSSPVDDGRIIIGGSLLGNIWIGHTTPSSPSLQGQVIIGANGLGTATWTGSIREDGVILSLGSIAPDVAPYYTRPSSELGGGAVGLVPYRLYNIDCSPPHPGTGIWNDTPGADPLLNSQFSHWTNTPPAPAISPRSVTMSFYGPIGSNLAKPVRVWVWLYNHLWLDVTDKCDEVLNGRTITISGHGNQMLPPGFYAATAPTSLNDPERLFCLGTTASTPPSVFPNAFGNDGTTPIVQYNFYLFSDCEPYNRIDTSETNCGLYCYADADDGSLTGHPDGGVTIDDLLYYLTIFTSGSSWADLDDGTSTGHPDGGVTIDDLLFFLVRDEAGC